MSPCSGYLNQRITGLEERSTVLLIFNKRAFLTQVLFKWEWIQISLNLYTGATTTSANNRSLYKLENSHSNSNLAILVIIDLQVGSTCNQIQICTIEFPLIVVSANRDSNMSGATTIFNYGAPLRKWHFALRVITSVPCQQNKIISAVSRHWTVAIKVFKI